MYKVLQASLNGQWPKSNTRNYKTSRYCVIYYCNIFYIMGIETFVTQ